MIIALLLVHDHQNATVRAVFLISLIIIILRIMHVRRSRDYFSWWATWYAFPLLIMCLFFWNTTVTSHIREGHVSGSKGSFSCILVFILTQKKFPLNFRVDHLLTRIQEQIVRNMPVRMLQSRKVLVRYVRNRDTRDTWWGVIMSKRVMFEREGEKQKKEPEGSGGEEWSGERREHMDIKLMEGVKHVNASQNWHCLSRDLFSFLSIFSFFIFCFFSCRSSEFDVYICHSALLMYVPGAKKGMERTKRNFSSCLLIIRFGSHQRQ